MAKDPVQTNPANFRVVFENERVRVTLCSLSVWITTRPEKSLVYPNLDPAVCAGSFFLLYSYRATIGPTGQPIIRRSPMT
jgi:hypothetical protein